MIYLNGEKVVMVDVDDTILKWSPTLEEIDKNGIEFLDENSNRIFFVPMEGNIEQLKKFKMRGFKVVVWSAGGCAWAKMAVEILNLENYVDLIMAKPSYVIDDLPASEFMPKSQWLEDK